MSNDASYEFFANNRVKLHISMQLIGDILLFVKGLFPYHQIGDDKITEFTDEEFRDLLLIDFDRTHLENHNHLERMVHFFLYDYKFERIWKTPDSRLKN